MVKRLFLLYSFLPLLLLWCLPQLSLATTLNTTILSRTGTTTKDLSSTTTTTIAHGLGVTPTAVWITISFGGSNSSSTFGTTTIYYSNSTQSALYGYENSGASESFFGNGGRVYTTIGSNDRYNEATVTTDSTNISITWSTSNSPTGTGNISWQAIGQTTTSITEEDNQLHGTAGNGIGISGNTITSNISAGSGISISGTTTYTITNSSPEDNLCHATAGSGISISTCTITNSAPESTTTIPFSNITSTPTTLSGYGITDSVPSTRTLTIDGTGYDLTIDRSWTTTGGGGGCTDYSCLTGTEDVVALTDTTKYSIATIFLFIILCLTIYLTYTIIKKSL